MNVLKLFLTGIVLLFWFQPALAGQHIVKGPAAKELLTVVGRDRLPESAAYSAGSHGFKSRCYKGSTFLLLKTNALGEGYEFSNQKPKDASCLRLTGSETDFQNELGLQVGVDRAQVEQALSISLPSNEETVIYQSTTSINNKTYDVQTWVRLFFAGDALSTLSVFTTTTH